MSLHAVKAKISTKHKTKKKSFFTIRSPFVYPPLPGVSELCVFFVFYTHYGCYCGSPQSLYSFSSEIFDFSIVYEKYG